jgi:hypothetical protein
MAISFNKMPSSFKSVPKLFSHMLFCQSGSSFHMQSESAPSHLVLSTFLQEIPFLAKSQLSFPLS